MCGRYVLATSIPVIAEYFGANYLPDLAENARPSWNIPPSMSVPGITTDAKGERSIAPYRWGLVPPWSKSITASANTANARAETVATKPSFRDAFRSRRCLIPADGYFEWKTTAGELKQPYYFTRRDEQLLAFAGLWEAWRPPRAVDRDEEWLYTCSIVTTEANPDITPIHTRMPAILDATGAAAWLDPTQHDRTSLESLLLPAPEGTLLARRVSTAVGNVRNDGPNLIEEEPVSPALF